MGEAPMSVNVRVRMRVRENEGKMVRDVGR